MDETITAGGLDIAVVGAGPVGLALALMAGQRLPRARVTLYDARPTDRDVSADGRTLALSLGSIQMLQRLGVWHEDAVQPIEEVHVSQQPPSLGGLLGAWLGEPEVRIRAVDVGVARLGAVVSYGALVAPMQAAWLTACERSPARLTSRFGTPVAALKNLPTGVEIDAGISERHDLAVVAEGGVHAGESPRQSAPGGALQHDYGQTAWVGSVAIDGGRSGVAYERFTRHGPVALLPLPQGRAALVWCVPSSDDPVATLDDAQRVAVLNTLFAAEVGHITEITPLKRFPLALVAQRTLTEGRTVRIGNAAQTLHPVAGQGLNLGLRDAHELVQRLARRSDVGAVLRGLEWQRGPDRWAMIATTDFLARSFTWRLPGAGTARGLALAALQAAGPAKRLLARHMMYGRR